MTISRQMETNMVKYWIGQIITEKLESIDTSMQFLKLGSTCNLYGTKPDQRFVHYQQNTLRCERC